jgi:hypothetical protein
VTTLETTLERRPGLDSAKVKEIRAEIERLEKAIYEEGVVKTT